MSQDGTVQGNPPRPGPVSGAVREHAGHTQAPPPPGSWLAWHFCPLPATLLGPLDSRKQFRCEDRTHILLDAGAREGGRESREAACAPIPRACARTSCLGSKLTPSHTQEKDQSSLLF